MSAPSCRTTVPMSTLIAYWLGELGAAAESEFEEHLFGCAHCTGRLRALVQLGEGIKRATLDGNLNAVVTAPFISRLLEAGFTIREYRMGPGGSVMCTVAPEDDLVVAHLEASLRDVAQLDVVFHDPTAGTSVRAENVAFDPAADEIVIVPNVAQLRQLGTAIQRAELVAVDEAGERVIGVYTFNHYPHSRRG